MRHAVLGGGGIGGLLAASLSRANADALLLLRPETLARYPGRIEVDSAVLGNFRAEVEAASILDREVDVLWVATKAMHLEAALAAAPAEHVGGALVIPLLNGVDHLALLRSRYPRVAAGAIRVESERVPPALIRQRSPFIRVDLEDAAAVRDELLRAGLDCRSRDDALSLLWDKLAFLGPVALATTALDAPLGGVRDDDRFLGCREEAFEVAAAEGARIDAHAVRDLAETAPAGTRSSMQKDVRAGRPPELDAIAGPILRGGARHAIPTPATSELVELVRARMQP
jgi:2-dehydropantoate 2-reductase